MSVKDFDGLWVSFHTPVIDRIVCHKRYGIERDPLPKCNILSHGVGLHLALHFNVENLKGFCRWNSGTEVIWIKQQKKNEIINGVIKMSQHTDIQLNANNMMCTLNCNCEVKTNMENMTKWLQCKRNNYNANIYKHTNIKPSFFFSALSLTILVSLVLCSKPSTLINY